MRAQHLSVVASLTFAQLHSRTVDGGFAATVASSTLSTSVARVVSFVEGGHLLKSFVFLGTILPSVVLSAVTMLPFF